MDAGLRDGVYRRRKFDDAVERPRPFLYGLKLACIDRSFARSCANHLVMDVGACLPAYAERLRRG